MIYIDHYYFAFSNTEEGYNKIQLKLPLHKWFEFENVFICKTLSPENQLNIRCQGIDYQDCERRINIAFAILSFLYSLSFREDDIFDVIQAEYYRKPMISNNTNNLKIFFDINKKIKLMDKIPKDDFFYYLNIFNKALWLLSNNSLEEAILGFFKILESLSKKIITKLNVENKIQKGMKIDISLNIDSYVFKINELSDLVIKNIHIKDAKIVTILALKILKIKNIKYISIFKIDEMRNAIAHGDFNKNNYSNIEQTLDDVIVNIKDLISLYFLEQEYKKIKAKFKIYS